MSPFLLALDLDPGTHPEDGDSEMVLVEVSADEIELQLQDGRRLIFDRLDLLEALSEALAPEASHPKAVA